MTAGLSEEVVEENKVSDPLGGSYSSCPRGFCSGLQWVVPPLHPLVLIRLNISTDLCDLWASKLSSIVFNAWQNNSGDL